MRVRALEENELFEQILLQGSKIGLEPSPSSNDIDAILTSMMGPSLNLNRNAPIVSSPAPWTKGPTITSTPLPPELQPLEIDPVAPHVTPGPWNNYGKARPSRRRSSVREGIPFPTPDDMSFQVQNPRAGGSRSGTVTPQAQVGGKRSRNGTSRSKRKT